MAKTYISETSNADPRSQQVINLAKSASRTVKSTFNHSIWKDGQTIVLTGYDFVFSDEDLAQALKDNPTATDAQIADGLRTYPVFTTELVNSDGSKRPYNPLWLKTTIASVEDALADEHTPEGTFNVLCREVFDQAQNDEDALKQIIARVGSKPLMVSRKKPYKEDYFGRIRTRKLLEFDLKEQA